MTKTTNYQLNQWAKSDRIMMDDFNADNQKIDAAIKAVADGQLKLAMGTYTGDGTHGQSNPNTLTFDFAPKAVLITKTISLSGQHQMLALSGQTNCAPTGGSGGGMACACSFSENSFKWYCADNQNGASYQFNSSGTKYLYIAIG